MQINNEQANALRAALKDLSLNPAAPRVRDDSLYDDLSRLNNELANLQRELVRKNVELARLNEEKNQWLGMAAHDLRTPLGVIQNYAEFLLDEAGPALSAEHLRFLELIHRSSQFSHRLVGDLLDVAVIESGELRLDLQAVDLTELVQHSVTLHGVLALKKNIRIVFDVADVGQFLPLPPVLADAGKLQQVLTNLLDNAVKFSHPGTEVVVRLAYEGEQEHAHHAVITVADHGQGIPADELGKLFKPFGRTRVRTTGGETSSGLGLAIVRRIVEGHHGEMMLASTLGRGSTFGFRLPISLPLPPAPTLPPTPPST